MFSSHLYVIYIYIYHTHIVFPPQLYNVCIPHSVFDQMYSIIEGKNQRFSSPIQSWKLSYYCPGFQSISCVYVHAWKTEVRDVFLPLVISMAGSILSSAWTAYKHFPLFSSHCNKCPWLFNFSHWKLLDFILPDNKLPFKRDFSDLKWVPLSLVG